VIQEGARLRAQLPAYLAQRRALVHTHCPLPAPLQAIVSAYQERTTTEELGPRGSAWLHDPSLPFIEHNVNTVYGSSGVRTELRTLGDR
jgi:hypothetical protein